VIVTSGAGRAARCVAPMDRSMGEAWLPAFGGPPASRLAQKQSQREKSARRGRFAALIEARRLGGLLLRVRVAVLAAPARGAAGWRCACTASSR
jgi:hypothetical protein